MTTIPLQQLDVTSQLVDRLETPVPHTRDPTCMSVHATVPPVQLCTGDDPMSIALVTAVSLHLRVPEAVRDIWSRVEDALATVELPPSHSGRPRRLHSVLGGGDGLIVKLRIDPRTHTVYDYASTAPSEVSLAPGQYVVPVIRIRGMWATDTHYGIVLHAHATAVTEAPSVSDDGDMTTQATMPFRFRQPTSDLTEPSAHMNDDPLTDDDGDFETEVCLRKLTHAFTHMHTPGVSATP